MTTTSGTIPAGRTSAVEVWTMRVALAAVSVFLVYLALRLRAVIGAQYANSDTASALVLAQFLGEHGHSAVILGDYRWLEPLYALHLTRWLPAHRQAWELMPYLAFALTVGVTAWTVRRAVSARAGLLVALAMAAPAPIILGFVGVENAHAHTLAHTVLLAAFLVTAPSLRAWSRLRQAVWALALTATLAPGVSSDLLLLVSAVPAFLAAVGAGWRLGLLDRASALLAGAACAVGTAGGLALVQLAGDHGIVSSGRPITLATADQLTPHLRLLMEALGLYGHGRIGGELTFWNAIFQLLGLAAMVAIPVLLVRGRGRVPTALRSPLRPADQRLLLGFWTVVLAATVLAFVASSSPLDVYSARYTLALWPALLTLWAIVAPARVVHPALAGLAIVAAVLGVVDLARGSYTTTTSPFPQGRVVGQLKRFVAAERLDHGYAGYWDAATITAQTDFAVRLYPVQNCGDGRCPALLHRIDAWYQPRPGRPMRTFYVVDDVPIGVGTAVDLPPARWGRPAKHVTFGQLQVYVYDYDLAARLPQGT